MPLQSGSIVTPYGSVGNAYRRTASLKHFFRCLEGSGNTIVDSVGGVRWTTARPTYWDATAKTFDVDARNSNLPEPIVGSWAPVTPTSFQLSILVGRVNCRNAAPDYDAVRWARGDINNIFVPAYATPAGVGLAGATFHSAIGLAGAGNIRYEAGGSIASTFTVTAGNYTYTSVPTVVIATVSGSGAVITPLLSGGTTGTITGFTLVAGGNDYEVSNLTFSLTGGGGVGTIAGSYGANVYPNYLGYSSDTNLNPYQGRDVILYAALNSAAQTIVYKCLDAVTGAQLITAPYRTTNSAINFTPNPCMRLSSIKAYAMMVFDFPTAFPADLTTGVMWMGAACKSGNKDTYPAWAA